ncbi:MAG: phosphoribosylamine--glycine ligase [bacterium]|nr:phosphoribosylamine--glycine ligase [bacterium]
MKILVIGGGGREHALVWKLAQSRQVVQLYAIPGNAGIAQLAECVNISLKDNYDQLAEFVEKNQIDLTVVGPEAPLVEGIVDYFQSRGLAIFGPCRAAAQLEGSKCWAKEFMTRHNLPTAKYKVFNNLDEAVKYVSTIPMPTVVKADGLAAGKGVLICKTQDEAIKAVDLIMSERAFGAAGDRIIIEDCLVGKEVSMLAFTDGTTIVPMVTAQDYKRALDNDIGLNTGGMGSISPSPNVTPELANKIYDKVLVPTICGLNKDGIRYVGVVYAGLMVVEEEPYLLEYNCRFGDPETQVILPRLKTDLVEIIRACLANKLDEINIEWDENSAVCVVLASGGYPGKYETGYEIIGLNKSAFLGESYEVISLDKLNLSESLIVYHAGTAIGEPKEPRSVPKFVTYSATDALAESKRGINKFLTEQTRIPFPESEEGILKLIAEKMGIPFVNISDFPVNMELLEEVPLSVAKTYKIFPLKLEEDGAILIAMADPLNIELCNDLKLLLNRPVKCAIASEKDIDEAITIYYGIAKETVEKMGTLTEEQIRNMQSRSKDKKIVTSGGRVLNIVALGNSISEAREKVYETINRIHFKDMHYRTDIGLK